MLRAIMSISELSGILSEESLNFVGQSFPELKQDSSPCTVIEIIADEKEGNWRAGFYLIAKEPLHFEDSLRMFRKAASGCI